MEVIYIIPLQLIPVAGAAYGGYRMTGTVLHCRHCGHQLTESVQNKARGVFDRAKESAQAILEETRQPSIECSACGHKSTGRFCANCGAQRSSA